MNQYGILSGNEIRQRMSKGEYVGKYVGQEAATPSRLYQEMGKTMADAARGYQQNWRKRTQSVGHSLGC